MAQCLVLGPNGWEDRDLSVREHNREIMRKYEGFVACNGMSQTICDNDYRPCCGLVLLYARLGLHRYNLLQGKNLQLRGVKKYNKTFGGCAAATYYITLEAEDPDRRNKLLTLQAAVGESGYNKFHLHCHIARILGETKKDATMKKVDPTVKKIPYYSIDELMPNLPLENPFKNSSRFYVLKKSELQDNDWIRLYLDLAVATTYRRSLGNEAPTDLKIMQVSVETTQDPDTGNQGHDVYKATFYIRYQDPCEARVGKDVDRIALARRFLDKNSGCFLLVGRTQSLPSTIPAMAKKNRFRPLLSVHKPWCLYSLRRHKSYRGFRLARRLHKTRSI